MYGRIRECSLGRHHQPLGVNASLWMPVDHTAREETGQRQIVRLAVSKTVHPTDGPACCEEEVLGRSHDAALAAMKRELRP
jgi:hypothetical protein